MKTELDDKRWKVFYRKFQNWENATPERIGKALSDGAELLLREARINLSGSVLKIGSGTLRNSTTKQPAVGAYHTGNSFLVQVGPGRNAFYGGAWEKGYKVAAITLRPTTKKAMAFIWKGKGAGGFGLYVVAKVIYRKAYSVAARPWLWPAYEKVKDNINKILEHDIGRGLAE